MTAARFLASPLDQHNYRVNCCRRFMAQALGFSCVRAAVWKGKCRSDRWGKRGRGIIGFRAQRLAMESRMARLYRERDRKPKQREYNRRPFRINTSRSAGILLEMQELMRTEGRWTMT